MDTVSNILNLLKLRASVFFHASFCGSWAIDGDSGKRATFHLIARGNCWLHLNDRKQSIALTGGDLIVFTRHVAHSISDSEHVPQQVDVPPRPAAENESPTASLVCGWFDFSSPQANPILDALPDVIQIRNEDAGRSSQLNNILQMIATEVENETPGSDTIIDKLSEVLFVHVIRAYLADDRFNQRSSIMNAFADPRLGKVINAVHQNPGRKWNLVDLAAIAGMSRSTFSRDFLEKTALSPMQYVIQWRMSIAYERLRSSRDSVAGIAFDSGYGTEAAFRKAFKQHFGEGPGAVRRQYSASDPSGQVSHQRQ